MNRIPRRWPWLLTAVLLQLIPIANRPWIVGGDEPHYALMAHSIAVDRDLDLTEDYARVEAGSKEAGGMIAGKAIDRHVRRVGEREVFSHPLGLPLLLAPIVALQQAIAPGSPPDLLLLATTTILSLLALVTGWRLLAIHLGDAREAALLAGAVWFSSPLWFYGRTLFTEPYTVAFSIFAVAAVVRQRLGLANLFLALTLAMKETGAILVAAIVIGAWRTLGWRKAALLTIGPALFGVAWIAKNVALTGEAFTTFQPFILGNPFEGALGLLVDAQHGLLWFAPLCVAAIVLLPKSRSLAAAVAFLGYFVVSAAWTDWRGGSCWGPRLLVPALPALALALARLGRYRHEIVGTLFVAGFVVNWTAAADPFTAFWGIEIPPLIAKNLPVALGGIAIGFAIYRWTLRRFPEHVS